MRLTLRTLLAYLDDTLEPMEIRRIGQKVAESDAAQELIARIKQTTRRRRLTTPPATGPGAFDPNTVADYLDNELPAEQVAELEKICLESDVHLAEIASCHQILTLVLGEPALVPPTAKERMYGLVQGREAIPFRKAAAPGGNAAAPTAADADADEMFLLGLPFYRRGSWLRWALPLAGVFLLVALAVALWQALPSLRPTQTQVVSNGDTPPPVAKTNGERDKGGSAKEKDKGTQPTQPSQPDDGNKPKPVIDKNKTKPESSGTTPPNNTPPDKDKNIRQVSTPDERRKPPSTDRVVVGAYDFGPKSLPSVLVQRKDGDDAWHRLAGGARLFSTDRLVSLPGYASEVRLDSGVHLLLRGHLREFSIDPLMDFLQESAVVLHHNKDLDADLTLDRGRLYVSNHKNEGAAVVRLRFGGEVWDVTLEEPGSEVVMDLIKHYVSGLNYNDGEEPLATLIFVVLRGKADLAIDYNHYSNLRPSGPSVLTWDNKGRGVSRPQSLPSQILPLFDRVPSAPMDRQRRELADAMNLALKEVSLRMRPDQVPNVALAEVLSARAEVPWQHFLAIYCLGAIDDVRELLRVLGDSDPVHAPDRDTAIFTLRYWLGRDARQGPRLYDEKNRSGVLLTGGQEYRNEEARIVFVLLHGFSDEDRSSPATYQLLAGYLVNDKVAIAELAFWHLRRLCGRVKVESFKDFNAAFPREAREKVAAEVKKLVMEGKLPPRPGRGDSGTGSGSPPPPKGKSR